MAKEGYVLLSYWQNKELILTVLVWQMKESYLSYPVLKRDRG